MKKLKKIANSFKASVLCLRFPFLYPRNRFTDKPCHLIPQWTELDAMPSGWRKSFGIDMCKEIKRELKKHKGLLKNYRITQIKEKFGGLRWYDNGAPEKIWREIIPKYEAKSYKTCIECGKPAEYISVGWVSPYCGNCANINRNYIKMTEEDAWDKALCPWLFNKEEE